MHSVHPQVMHTLDSCVDLSCRRSPVVLHRTHNRYYDDYPSPDSLSRPDNWGNHKDQVPSWQWEIKSWRLLADGRAPTKVGCADDCSHEHGRCRFEHPEQ